MTPINYRICIYDRDYDDQEEVGGRSCILAVGCHVYCKVKSRDCWDV